METKYVVDIIIALLFLLVFSVFLVKNKKNVKFEKMLFPFFYAFLYRGQFGIKFLEKFTKKHKELVRLFGYSSIGFGFIGMLLATIMMFFVTFSLIFKPGTDSVAPFLPFTNVPGVGYITFVHWIIAIFIIVVVHESAHAIVALSHGLKIKNTGFGLFAIFMPFLPAAFVEPDEEQVKKKSDVVQYSIFAAGPMSNFLLMIPLALLLFSFPVIDNVVYDPVGFSFDPINETGYPALATGMGYGETFNMFNGKNYTSIEGPYSQMITTIPGQVISYGYFNESKDAYTSYYYLTTIENPDFEGRGFLGVTNIRTVFKVKPFFRYFEGIYSWFRGLVKILFVVTFAIGLINLFPAGMIDGGRMFMLALFKITGDKKKTEKIASLLATFFWIVIMFGFVTYFTGNPFSLFFN